MKICIDKQKFIVFLSVIIKNNGGTWHLYLLKELSPSYIWQRSWLVIYKWYVDHLFISLAHSIIRRSPWRYSTQSLWKDLQNNGWNRKLCNYIIVFLIIELTLEYKIYKYIFFFIFIRMEKSMFLKKLKQRLKEDL